jgi:hypothetical protein
LVSDPADSAPYQASKPKASAVSSLASPASKTRLLLGEANVGIDVMINDWNGGWNELAQFLWAAMYEVSVYTIEKGNDTAFRGLVVKTRELIPADSDNVICLDDLKLKIVWSSQASVDYLNPGVRRERFMQLFQFFMPLLNIIAQFNPDLFRRYFVRWMRRAAYELDVPSISNLIPSEKEISAVPTESLMGVLNSLGANMRGNRGGGGLELGGE